MVFNNKNVGTTGEIIATSWGKHGEKHGDTLGRISHIALGDTPKTAKDRQRPKDMAILVGN
jgi:hypothetical protein